MSVANGFKDVMIEKQDNGTFKVFGLSPAGHTWCDRNLAAGVSVFSAQGSVAAQSVGEIVRVLIDTKLSVEIR